MFLRQNIDKFYYETKNLITTQQKLILNFIEDITSKSDAEKQKITKYQGIFLSFWANIWP